MKDITSSGTYSKVTVIIDLIRKYLNGLSSKSWTDKVYIGSADQRLATGINIGESAIEIASLPIALESEDQLLDGTQGNSARYNIPIGFFGQVSDSTDNVDIEAQKIASDLIDSIFSMKDSDFSKSGLNIVKKELFQWNMLILDESNENKLADFLIIFNYKVENYGTWLVSYTP